MSAMKNFGMRSLTSHIFKRLQKSQERVPFQTLKSSSSNVDINKVSLSEPVPGIPTPIYAKVTNEITETKVTTLSNGLRVASENKFGQFCTVGIIIDSGSRYEVAYPNGISHFLERLAFNSTTEYSDREAIMADLEKFGGICDCQSSRDTIIYATSVNCKGLDVVVKLLSEVVLGPKFTAEEMSEVQTMIGYELKDMNMKPEQDPLLTEMIHAAAYNNNTLGLPKFCPTENISKINQQILFTYLKNHHTPERMVLAGVGIEHDALVEATEKYFVKKKPIWEVNSDLILPENIPVDSSISQYSGGTIQVEKDLSNISMGPTPIPELAHFVLGLESCSHQDPDFVAFCVLNMMMGGGGSFSAGGPGKGMYTRLYTNVLNRYHWMYNATAYNHAYNDSGLFCIHASANPKQLKDLIEVIIKEFVSTAGDVGKSELQRAKTQLQSMLLMNLESRPVVFEDIARQVLATGHRKPPQYFIDEISKITAEDIQRVASRMLRSKPAIAALGDLRKLPTSSDIEYGLIARDGSMPRKFSGKLFR